MVTTCTTILRRIASSRCDRENGLLLRRYWTNGCQSCAIKQSGRRVKKMQFGPYAKGGWTEIDALAGNPGAYNQIRVLVRVVKGDFEVKLLQVH